MPLPPLTLAAIRQPALLYDTGGRIVAANEPAEAFAGRPLAGCSAAAVVGIFDIRHLDGTPLTAADLPATRVLAGEEAVDVLFKVTAADSRTVHILASASPLRDGAAIVGALSIWQDVSALEAARAGAETAASALARERTELDRQRRLLGAILAALPHRVSLWDRDQRLVWANERFAAERGGPPEALVGRTWRELGYDPALIEPLNETIRQSTSAGRSLLCCEAEVVGPTGAPWLAVTAVPIFEDSVLIVSEDVTERKRAEDALRESAERLRLAKACAGIGMWEWLPPGASGAGASECVRLDDGTGLELQQFNDWQSTVHPDDLARVEADREAALARGETFEVEFRYDDGTGATRWMRVLGGGVFDEAGRLVRVLGVNMDITAQKQAEAALQESERRHAFLLALGDRLREPAGAREIAAVASELLGRHLGVSGVVYCEVAPAGEHATVRADWTDGTVPGAAGPYWIDDFGISDLYRRGLVRWTDDVTTGHDEDEASAYSALGIRASLGVPICRGGRLVAILAACSALPRAWTDAEVELVREAGDRIWAAVERARAEEALRLSEERLRLAQEGAGIGIWDRDAATGRVTISPGFLRPYGMEATAISSYEDLVPWIHPDDRETVEAERRAAFAADEPLNLEFRVITPSGEARWIQFQGRGVTDTEGALARVIGVLIDTTDRRRAEAELREREQTLQGIFRAAPVGIGMVSHRKITMVNDQLCRMTGYARDELIGKDARLFYPTDEAYEYVGREKYARIAEKGAGAVETQWRTRGGTILDILLSSSPIDLSRPHENVIFSALDITRLRESERSLASYMDDLQRSNEELQRFAYVASHDLQEPLRSIVSFSQLLERRYKGRLDTDADEFIAFIIEGGTRMQRLIQDLLQLSRVETKAKPLAPTDAGEVVADALRLMETPVREAGATVDVGGLPTVMADAAQLAQVFTNLVGNALKYRRPGVPPEIRISAERAGKFWRFAVEDNGIGIEPEYFDRIFVIFQRLHTRDEYEGTGIGLAVVRKIVERHGGRIGVESVPGEGSTFFFTLPAA